MMAIAPAETSSPEGVAASQGALPKAVFPPARKLSDEQERELTRLYGDGSTPIADIARTFGLSEVSVGRIARRNGATSRRQRAGSRARPAPRRHHQPAPTEGSARAARPVAASPGPPTTPRGDQRGARRRFRVRFVGETVVEAEDMRDAVGQAEALGATDILSIAREDATA